MFMDDHNLKVEERFKIETYEGEFWFDNFGYLNATLNDEKVGLLNALLDEEVQVEKLKKGPWKPKKGEEYYRINNYGVISATVNESEMDDYYFEHNLAFRTKTEAEDYKWFLDKVDEYKKPFDFSDIFNNYYLYYDYGIKAVGYSSTLYYQVQGVVYFGDEDNIVYFIEEVGEDRIKKYMFGIYE